MCRRGWKNRISAAYHWIGGTLGAIINWIRTSAHFARIRHTLRVLWIIAVDTAFVISWLYFDEFAESFFSTHEHDGIHAKIRFLFRICTSGCIAIIALTHIALDVAKAVIFFLKETREYWREQMTQPEDEDGLAQPAIEGDQHETH